MCCEQCYINIWHLQDFLQHWYMMSPCRLCGLMMAKNSWVYPLLCGTEASWYRHKVSTGQSCLLYQENLKNSTPPGVYLVDCLANEEGRKTIPSGLYWQWSIFSNKKLRSADQDGLVIISDKSITNFNVSSVKDRESVFTPLLHSI